MAHAKQLLLCSLFASIMLGCKPEVGQAPSLVTDYALLAVRGEPPEAKPGADVVYSFLLASPAGTVTDATAGWDVCVTPKPPAENNSVSSACNPPAPGTTPGQTFEPRSPPMPARCSAPSRLPRRPASRRPTARPR